MSSECYTVVVWGDSIAAGNAEFNWPAIAELSLNVVASPGRPVKIINEATCGKPASAARAEFAQRVLAHDPDLVILQFGFNDVRHDGSRGDRPISTPDEFKQALAEMIAKCRDEAGARVCVLGNHRTLVSLTLPTGLTYEEARVQYNGIAASAAHDLGADFHDMSEFLERQDVPWQDMVCDDGVHLSPRGYHFYGRAVADMIGTSISDPARGRNAAIQNRMDLLVGRSQRTS